MEGVEAAGGGPELERSSSAAASNTTGRPVPVGLRPFTSASGREAGRRSAEARRQRAGAERAARATASTLVEDVRTLASIAGRVDLGSAASAAAVTLIGRVERGEVPVKDPAAWLRALVDVARLERGEPTALAAVAHLSGPALVDRLRALQLDPSAAVEAAHDVEAIEPGPSLASEVGPVVDDVDGSEPITPSAREAGAGRHP